MPEHYSKFSMTPRFKPYSFILLYFYAYLIPKGLTFAAIVRLSQLNSITHTESTWNICAPFFSIFNYIYDIDSFVNINILKWNKNIYILYLFWPLINN